MPASWLRRRRLGRLGVSVVGGLVFFGRNVVELAVQPAVVEPIDPLHRGVFHVVEGAQRAAEERATATDSFGLEQPNRGLRQSVVIGVADAADRCRNTFQYKGFSERDRRVLRAGIAV